MERLETRGAEDPRFSAGQDRKKESSARKLKVLLVEDSEDDAALILTQLRMSGYEAAHDRVEAAGPMRAALQLQPWDVILSDYLMPRFDAPGALRVLKESGLDIPFIVVSGVVGEAAAVEMMRQGASDYVMKDNLTRLGAAVRRELRVFAEKREAAQGETALRESEGRYRTLFDTALDAVLVADASTGVIVDANAQAERLFKRSKAQLIGMHQTRIHPPHLAEYYRDQFSRHGTGADLVEGAQIMAADGTIVPVRISATPLTLAGQRVLIGVFHDESSLRETEEALRLSREQLFQSQKLEAVGRLAGGVAHDFNNLLTAITAYSDFLLKTLPPEDPRAADAKEIKSAADKAALLTRQLLAFSRKQVLEPRVLNLNACVEDMGRLIRRTIGEDIQLIQSLAPDLGAVKADATQLSQVVLNLVVNARDAMPEGGKIIIETANADLAEPVPYKGFTLPPGRYAVLVVSDTGCGMTDAVQDHLFEPFFTTKERGKGTGLGLPTVYGIVKQSAGFISIYSAAGRGTTIKIHLPRTDEKPTGLEGGVPGLDALRGRETILLAEDDDLVRRTASRVLRNCGYRLLEARDGEEALRLAADHAGGIDLLLTDVIMPGLDGRQLSEKLLPLRPGTRALFMSGYTDALIAQRGMLEPGLHFIQKPFAPTDLARKVRQVLDAPRS